MSIKDAYRTLVSNLGVISEGGFTNFTAALDSRYGDFLLFWDSIEMRQKDKKAVKKWQAQET